MREVSVSHCVGGGDARRRRKTERGSFSASLLSRKSAALGFGRLRRPRRPRPRAKSANGAKQRKSGWATTLKGDPPRRARRATLGTREAHSSQRARRAGLGVPRAIVGETRSTLKRRRWESPKPPFGRARQAPTPPRRGYPLAEGDPKGALDIMGTILFKPYQD